MAGLINGAAAIPDADEFHTYSSFANDHIPAPAGSTAATPGMTDGAKPDAATMDRLAFDDTRVKDDCNTCKKKKPKGQMEPGDVKPEDLKGMSSSELRQVNNAAMEHATVHADFANEAYDRGNIDLAHNESMASFEGNNLSKMTADELADRAAVSPDDYTAKFRAEFAAKDAATANDAWFHSIEKDDLSGMKPGMESVPDNLGRPDLRMPGDEPYPGFHRPEPPVNATG